MTTFKNNAKYAELLLMYLDVAMYEEIPLSMQEVLGTFEWRFKGGSLAKASQATRLKPEVSGDVFPDGWSGDMAKSWPEGEDCRALSMILLRRRTAFQVKARALLSRLGTYLMLTSRYGLETPEIKIHTGMKAIYYVFGRIWEWAKRRRSSGLLERVHHYTREMCAAGAEVSRMHVKTVEANRKAYQSALEDTPLGGLLDAVTQIKRLIREACGKTARATALRAGQIQRDMWVEANFVPYNAGSHYKLVDQQEETRFIPLEVGPLFLRVSQRCALIGAGAVRYALGESDMERLHQLTMSSASALVGVAAQAAVGTPAQKALARRTVQVAVNNLDRIVQSSRKVKSGEEVLVCKGYRRAYTAHLGQLAGDLCKEETKGLVTEAAETADPGVLDVEGFMADARTLDAAGSLNACKMFKVCPAPDVSPGLAMIDRIKQIGDCNIADPDMMVLFKEELRAQILRAYIRRSGTRLRLRQGVIRPAWYTHYNMREFDMVPSMELHTYLAWEGTAEMPDNSPYDPANWKDSGLGADSIREARSGRPPGVKRNMLTRLLFDDECPMPGRRVLSDDHVIKFFVKAEGHKDPARGIFSANLTDRQAQSWMERAVDKVAREHPSYMIGQPAEVREARVVQLTTRPSRFGYVALYYSFDISGWSAKMPAEPQRISHEIWGQLYNEPLFRMATKVNEGAFVYVNIDGYFGHYTNTCSNLEGFNGKEMTMVLVAMLSLSVRRWRDKAVDLGLMTRAEADSVSALLFAYIDDGLSRIDLPAYKAEEAFNLYKETVIETFSKCGFSVEVSKCFPSDRFAIFLNEVYLAGRHVVHGVRAAMAISSEPTERHNSLIERAGSVATGCRGAVMAGLNPQSATILMSYHLYLHLLEWVSEKDPVLLAAWSYCPRAWGGLGMPQMMQLYTSGSGSAFEEGVATMQIYGRMNLTVKRIFLNLCRTALTQRDAVGVLTAPLSGKPQDGYMVDSRVARAVRIALQKSMDLGRVSTYAERLLRYADPVAFRQYAEAVVPLGQKETLQEQMLDNICEAHPHSVFSAFARRLEKSTTLMNIIGRDAFTEILQENRREAERSIKVFVDRLKR